MFFGLNNHKVLGQSVYRFDIQVEAGNLLAR
jgi:hypothetical protein